MNKKSIPLHFEIKKSVINDSQKGLLISSAAVMIPFLENSIIEIQHQAFNVETEDRFRYMKGQVDALKKLLTYFVLTHQHQKLPEDVVVEAEEVTNNF